MAARRIASLVLGALLFVVPTVSAQSTYKEFVSKEALFAANFPNTPVATTITWETEYGAKIPALVYTSTASSPQGTRKYVMTMVDYNPVRQIAAERAKSCDPRDERCGGTYPIEGVGYWKNDLRGAMIYAAAKYIQNDNYKVNHYMWNFLGGQGMEANELQLVNTKDKSLTHVTFYMHHNRLYIAEETTPAGYPPPGLFVQSITLKESDGTTSRHFGVYFNGPTIDPVESKSCTGGYLPGVESANKCLSLPADVRFQQGQNFSVDDTHPLLGTDGQPFYGRQEGAAPAGAAAPATGR